jgi:hypothetical protein
MCLQKYKKVGTNFYFILFCSQQCFLAPFYYYNAKLQYTFHAHQLIYNKKMREGLAHLFTDE